MRNRQGLAVDLVELGRNPYGVSRVIHALPKTREQAYAAAVPWHGGPPSDPHFSA